MNDIIYDKISYINGLLEFIGLPADDAFVSKLAASRAVVVPDAEAVTRHIRQVHPGDHVRKLSPAAIEELNMLLRPMLDAYGYAS